MIELRGLHMYDVEEKATQYATSKVQRPYILRHKFSICIAILSSKVLKLMFNILCHASTIRSRKIAVRPPSIKQTALLTSSTSSPATFHEFYRASRLWSITQRPISCHSSEPQDYLPLDLHRHANL